MSSHRVLLICSRHLFGEGVERILRGSDEVELIGPWSLHEDVCGRIGEILPNVVVVADEDVRHEESLRLVTALMEQFPELPVIRAKLSENVVRVFSAHLLPARGTDLLETICNLPIVSVGKSSNERSE